MEPEKETLYHRDVDCVRNVNPATGEMLNVSGAPVKLSTEPLEPPATVRMPSNRNVLHVDTAMTTSADDLHLCVAQPESLL